MELFAEDFDFLTSFRLRTHTRTHTHTNTRTGDEIESALFLIGLLPSNLPGRKTSTHSRKRLEILPPIPQHISLVGKLLEMILCFLCLGLEVFDACQEVLEEARFGDDLIWRMIHLFSTPRQVLSAYMHVRDRGGARVKGKNRRKGNDEPGTEAVRSSFLVELVVLPSESVQQGESLRVLGLLR